MSRREYDFENGDTSLDVLMKAINEQKANFGGDSMYIELARKFDNSDYQWVCYRNNINSETYGSPATTGYFVLFAKDGQILGSIAFSYPYLCHAITQCNITQTATPMISFMHCYLFVSRGAQIRYNYCDVYGVDIQKMRGMIARKSDMALKYSTSGRLGNFVGNYVYFYHNGTNLQWFLNTNTSMVGPTYVSLTMSSSCAYEVTLSGTAMGRSDSNFYDILICCEPSTSYKWITWSPASKNISFSTSTAPTGWSRSTTAVSPYANRYGSAYYLPIWSWSQPTASPTNVSAINNSLWWGGDGFVERKFMLQSGISSLTPTSTSENQDYYRIKASSATENYVHAFGLMTIDGRFIYTLNVNTKLLEKIDTKVR